MLYNSSGINIYNSYGHTIKKHTSAKYLDPRRTWIDEDECTILTKDLRLKDLKTLGFN